MESNFLMLIKLRKDIDMYAVTKLTTLLVNGESTPADAILSGTITNQFSLPFFLSNYLLSLNSAGITVVLLKPIYH